MVAFNNFWQFGFFFNYGELGWREGGEHGEFAVGDVGELQLEVEGLAVNNVIPTLVSFCIRAWVEY